jgi:hypothetical protein
MNKTVKAPVSLMITALMVLVVISVSSGSVYAQVSNPGSEASQRVTPLGQFYFADGRGSLNPADWLSCGLASPVASGRYSGPTSGGAVGQLVKVDLSFGLLPADDRAGARETYIGSWAVRNIYPSETSRGESVGLIYFNGSFTSGSITQVKGGATVFDLYGTTSFSSPVCGTKGDYKMDRYVQRYVRLYGVCGNDQDVTFEVARRPPVNHNGLLFFENEDLYAYARFKGNISCGQTTDRRRVRIDLTR